MGDGKKITHPCQRWVVGHVDAYAEFCTLTAWNRTRCFLTFTKELGIRDNMSQWQELRPFTLRFIPHFTATDYH